MTKALKKSEVVTFVTSKVIEHFSQFDSIPSKLEIQNYISSFVDDYKVDTGKFDAKSGEKILRDLSDFFTKLAVNEIKECQSEILKNISKVTYPEVVKSGNQKEALLKILHACKAFAWNIQKEDQVDFLEALFHCFENAKGVTKYQEGIYIKGEVEGGGKSTLIHSIVDPATGFTKVKNATWPTGRFADVSPFCSSNIAYIEDTSNNQKKEIDEAKLKAILRKEIVECERKGIDAVEMKSVASLIAAGNVEAPNSKDRCWRIFDVIPVDLKNPEFLESEVWKSICEQTGKLERGKPIHSGFASFENFGDFENFGSLLSKLKESEKGEKSTIQTTKYTWFPRLQNRLKYLPVILETLGKMKNGPFNFNYISAKQIIDFARDIGHPLNDEWKVISTLKLLAANGVIDKIKGNPTGDIYRRFDLKGLENLSYEELSGESPAEYVTESVEEQVKNSQLNWEKIIKYFESHFPSDPEPKKFLSDEPVEGDFPKNFLYKNSTPGYDKDGKYVDFLDKSPTQKHDETIQFIISNPPALSKEDLEKALKDPKLLEKLARGKYLRKCNFVFEIDPSDEEKAVLKTLSKEERVAKAKEYIEEQKRNVENLPQEVKDSIVSVTESGADSLHVILHTNNEHEESRREIWKYLSDKYFGGKADQQCSNTSRLTPNPNAIRNRKADAKPEFVGQRQNCWHFNKNPKEFDVKWIEEQVLRDIEEDRKRREQRAEENYSRDFQHQELTVETLLKRKQTPARDNAIALLEGNCCHGPEAVSGMMHILSTGWDEYEMESVIDKGTWSQAEYDGMVKAALNRLYK